MKGVGYGMVLIVSLLMINFMLYVYGVDIPVATWLGVGVTPSGTGTVYQPNSTTGRGDFSSPIGLQNMVTYIAVVIAGVATLGIVATILYGTTWLNWGIPLAMAMMMLLVVFTPMGNIWGAVPEEGGACFHYHMRAGIVRFGTPLTDECVPWEAHVMIAIFFGALTLVTFMSFVRGYEW